MKILLPLLLIFTAKQNLPAQKMLLLEKAERVRPQKFYVGDMLTYKLDERQATWFSDEIMDILPEEKTLVLGIQKVRIEDIAALRFRKNLLVGLAKTAGVFGTGLVVFSVGGKIADGNRASVRDAFIGGCATMAGSFLVLKFLKNRQVKMGKKYRLRTIEVPTVFF